MNPKQKAIKEALRKFGSTMHPGKKAAPGIHYDELSSREKYYRKNNQERSDNRLKKFYESPYGKHLTEREHRRGEN